MEIYSRLLRRNKVLREMLAQNEADLKQIEAEQGIERYSKDGGNYRTICGAFVAAFKIVSKQHKSNL